MNTPPLLLSNRGTAWSPLFRGTCRYSPRAALKELKKMNLQCVFREFLGAVQRDKSCSKTTEHTPGNLASLKLTEEISCVTNGTVPSLGCIVGLNDLPQPFPALFALTFHCSVQVSCGSLLLAWLGPQDSRDRQCVPKASLSVSF